MFNQSIDLCVIFLKNFWFESQKEIAEKIKHKDDMRLEIIENKSTDVKLFEYILNISDQKAKLKAEKRIKDKRNSSKESMRLSKRHKSVGSLKLFRSISKQELLPIKEDLSE